MDKIECEGLHSPASVTAYYDSYMYEKGSCQTTYIVDRSKFRSGVWLKWP